MRMLSGIRPMLTVFLTAGLLVTAAPAQAGSPINSPRTIVNVMNTPYSAAGDGVANDRSSIQRALDDVARLGGGTVQLPAGHTYLTGSLVLASNTTLEVDGTLLQSQSDADYGYTPIHGHNMPATSDCVSDVGPCPWDHSMYHNLPLLYAGNQHNVTITGDGVIQLSEAASDAATIHLTAVGLYRVSHYEISHVQILGAVEYNLSLFTTDHGLIKDLTITAAAGNVDGYHANTDGISLQNSQHVRITGNTIRNGDDAIYIWSSYRDPRAYISSLGGSLWWSTDEPQPSTDIEIDHNDVVHTPGLGVGFIVWGTGAPDQRSVEVSDVRIHDNSLTSTSRAIGCWCDNPYHGQSPFTNNEAGDQSAITGVQIFRNTYASAYMQGFVATDLKADFELLGANTVMNGDFEQTGTAWWSTRTEPRADSDVGATDQAHAAVLRNPQARSALRSMDGWVGYLQPRGVGFAELSQGLGLTGPIPNVGFDTGAYTLSTDVVTGSEPVQLFVYNTCTGKTLASKAFTSRTPTRHSVSFTMNSDCANVQVGVRTPRDHRGNTWALIDSVAVTRDLTAIDDSDPTVTYAGSWGTYANAGTWGGTDAVGKAAGASVTIPFTGVRAVVLAVTDYNLGEVAVYLDGSLVTTSDLYTPDKRTGQVVFDTGTVAAGSHTLELVTTGTKNPASKGTFSDWDAVLVQPS